MRNDGFPYPIGTTVYRTDSVIGYGSIGKIIDVSNYSYTVEIIHATDGISHDDQMWAHIFVAPIIGVSSSWEV
jgi:hypothetical protein